VEAVEDVKKENGDACTDNIVERERAVVGVVHVFKSNKDQPCCVLDESQQRTETSSQVHLRVAILQDEANYDKYDREDRKRKVNYPSRLDELLVVNFFSDAAHKIERHHQGTRTTLHA